LARAAFTNGGRLPLPRIEDGLHLGFIEYVLYGNVAAILAWAFSQATSNNHGVLALALISGFGGVFVIDKIRQGAAAASELANIAQFDANVLDDSKSPELVDDTETPNADTDNSRRD
jgi:hypothetical protein